MVNYTKEKNMPTHITVKFYSKSKLLFQRLKSKLIPPLYPPITGYLDGFLRKKKKMQCMLRLPAGVAA